MEKRKIFVLLGNPDKESFTASLAQTYEDAAKGAGHEIRRMNIGDMQFDPVLQKGYKEIQELEGHLKEMQENIRWAEHFVVVYPNWWCSMPAKLKGMFDRAWLPGFAFNFDKETHEVIQRLKGKTARVIVVAGTQSPFMTWWKYGDFTNEISRGILGFAGFDVAVTTFGPADCCQPCDRDGWVACTKSLGAAAS
ncbi:MAG: NAD(P)H-dependent oxidoreductase [Patescibacteria group bacterium]